MNFKFFGHHSCDLPGETSEDRLAFHSCTGRKTGSPITRKLLVKLSFRFPVASELLWMDRREATTKIAWDNAMRALKVSALVDVMCLLNEMQLLLVLSNI